MIISKQISVNESIFEHDFCFFALFANNDPFRILWIEMKWIWVGVKIFMITQHNPIHLFEYCCHYELWKAQRLRPCSMADWRAKGIKAWWYDSKNYNYEYVAAQALRKTYTSAIFGMEVMRVHVVYNIIIINPMCTGGTVCVCAVRFIHESYRMFCIYMHVLYMQCCWLFFLLGWMYYGLHMVEFGSRVQKERYGKI